MMSPLGGMRAIAQTWLDADEITSEDLKGPLTAEEEILDWMAETPVPRAVRPSWLPSESPWTPTPAPARRGPTRRPSRSRLAWLAVGAAGTGVCAMGGIALAAVLVALL